MGNESSVKKIIYILVVSIGYSLFFLTALLLEIMYEYRAWLPLIVMIGIASLVIFFGYEIYNQMK